MLIIHDNGKLLATFSGRYINPAVLVADVPEGYSVASVDIETNTPVLQKNPPTLEERIAELEAVNAALLGKE